MSYKAVSLLIVTVIAEGVFTLRRQLFLVTQGYTTLQEMYRGYPQAEGWESLPEVSHPLHKVTDDDP